MAVRIASESEGRTSERLTVGVAARLSQYLRVLTQARKMGEERISSQEISEYTNINATQIRRDLSAFGKFGKRGVGYNIDSLLAEVRKILRTQGQHIIVGVLAVPADSAQSAANDLVGAGVKILFNYSEALLDTPTDVVVHTSN